MWEGIPVTITYSNGKVEEGEYMINDLIFSKKGKPISFMGIWSYTYSKHKKVLLNRSVKNIVFDFEKYFNGVSK